MENNEKQRCVMISADHGLAIVYFLQTDVVQTMLNEGIKVVVLTDDGVTDKVREKFGQENLFVEGLRLDRAKKYFNDVDHSRQYWLHFLRWMGGSDKVNTTAIDCHLRQRDHESTLREKIFRMPLIREKTRQLRKSKNRRMELVKSQMQYTTDIYGDLFEKYQPDLVIASTAGWRLDRYLLREAARAGIETCLAVIGWDNPSSYRLPGAPMQWANCWSGEQKRELVDGADWDPERVNIGGIPTYDGYFRKTWRMSREDYFKLHGLDPDRKLLSFACSFITFSPNYQDIEALVKLVSEDRLAEPCQLLIRLHPNHFIKDSLFEEEAKKIRELIEGKPYIHLIEPVALGGDLGFYSGEDMPEKDSMMAWSDVFLTVYSTMVVETAIHDRPIIAVCIDAPGGWNKPEKFCLSLSEIGEWPTHERYRNAKAGRVVYNIDELKETLDLYLQYPETDHEERMKFIADECTFLDGSAGRHTGEYFAKLAKQARHHDHPVYHFDPVEKE